MSLGGNCADITYLGPKRIRGPVDNFQSETGLSSVFNLLDGTLEKEIEQGPIKTKSRKPMFKGDSPIRYYYSSHSSLHTDMTDPHIIGISKKRFKEFYEYKEKALKDPNKYFVYTIQVKDRSHNKGLKPNAQFLESLAKLSQIIPLEKIIFVNTPRNPGVSGIKCPFHAAMDTSDEALRGLKFITMEDLPLLHDKNHPEMLHQYQKFCDAIEKLL